MPLPDDLLIAVNSCATYLAMAKAEQDKTQAVLQDAQAAYDKATAKVNAMQAAAKAFADIQQALS